MKSYFVFIPIALMSSILLFAISAKSDDDLDNRFRQAVIMGQMLTVEKCLKEGANLQSTDQYLTSALHHAARFGHTKIAEVLLKSGANPDARDLNDVTPLMAAAKDGNARLIFRMLQKKANPNLQDMWGWTALMFAVRGDSVRASMVLMSYPETDTKIKNHGFKTAAEYAEHPWIKPLFEQKRPSVFAMDFKDPNPDLKIP